MRSLSRLPTFILLSVALLIAALLIKRTEATSSDQPTNRVELGSQLHMGGLDFAAAQQTLLIFSNSSCQYCLDELSFYRRLLRERDSADHSTAIVMLSAEPTQAFSQFVTRNGLGSAKIASIKSGDLGVRIVPTIVLADRSGIVLKVWTGKQSNATEVAILKATGASQ